MSKLERKKKRNEDRQDVVKSFADFGRTAMVREIRDMDEKKQKQILSKLDDEAADAFKGLLRITDKAAETHAPTLDLFDSVREVMQHMRKADYKEAYREVKALVEMPNALFKVRSILVRVGMDIAALARHQMGTMELEANETEANLIEKINFALSEVTAFGASDSDTIEASDFDVVDQTEVNLPSEVTEPIIVEATLLVLPDRKLRAGHNLGVRELASGTYLIEAELIGIPSDVPVEEREAMAQAFAFKERGASVTPLGLTRPDSDGVWFPLFKQRFAAEVVHFPDQARRYYGTQSGMSTQAAAQSEAKALRLAGIRADFETKNADLLNELNEARNQWEESSILAKELSVKFLAETNFLWNQKFEPIVNAEHALDLEAAGDDFGKRWKLKQAHEAKVKDLYARQQRIKEVRLVGNTAHKRLVELQAELAERKADTLNPYRQMSKRISNTGQQKQTA